MAHNLPARTRARAPSADRTEQVGAPSVHVYDPDRLVAENLGLARFLARRFSGRGVDQDDLESEAVSALWQAALAYDPRKGGFGSYARHFIAGDLIDLTGQAAWSSVAGITRQLRRDAQKLRRAAVALLSEGVNRPSLDEIAARAGIDRVAARKAWNLPEVRADQRAIERLTVPS